MIAICSECHDKIINCVKCPRCFVKYCSEECQIKHGDYHKNNCLVISEKISIRSTIDILRITENKGFATIMRGLSHYFASITADGFNSLIICNATTNKEESRCTVTFDKIADKNLFPEWNEGRRNILLTMDNNAYWSIIGYDNDRCEKTFRNIKGKLIDFELPLEMELRDNNYCSIEIKNRMIDIHIKPKNSIDIIKICPRKIILNHNQ